MKYRFGTIPDRRSLSSILSDQAFGPGEDGPSVEDDSAAYENFLKSGEEARRREEAAGVENVLGNLQSRGLARSGIALKDIVTLVLGPSSERAKALAAQFGLEQARRRSDVLESARGRAAADRSQRLGGRLSSILQSDQGDTSFGLGRQSGEYGILTSANEAAAADRRAQAERKGDRQNAVVGGIGSIIGGVLGGFCFHPTVKILMADGTRKKIGDVVLGEETKGGRVISRREAISADGYEYDGVIVTGSHSVNENGYWRHVEDSPVSKRLDGRVMRVVSIVTSDHRVWADGGMGVIEFADEAEHDQSARLGGNLTDVETLRELNYQENIKRGMKSLVEAK